MEKKIKVLFYNLDGSGVNYFRTTTPAMEIERNHSDEFYVEVNPNLDMDSPETLNYLKTFDIIHYHRQLTSSVAKLQGLAKELNAAGTLLVVDIDDYWHLHKNHPFHISSVENKLHIPIIENLKIANYCTTTTDVFANEIKKITKKDNVSVFYNSIDSTWMKQFQNNWKPDPDGLVRITYMAGSSHMGDVAQLEGVVNILLGDEAVKDRFKVILAGWDTEGETADITFNQDFKKVLESKNMLNRAIVKILNKTKGNVDAIPGLSDEIKNKFRGKVFINQKRTINSEESTYLFYEKILTNRYNLIKNPDYLQWLKNYERNVKYENEGNYARRWTEKANAYARVLDETDIVIAPLDDNEFNQKKSNLKQVECWTRKLPIVCSDVIPYNVEGRNMENCILIPPSKNSQRDWAKYLKKLILDADLRKRLGEQLYTDFNVRYNLANVTQKRVDFYKSIIAKRGEKLAPLVVPPIVPFVAPQITEDEIL